MATLSQNTPKASDAKTFDQRYTEEAQALFLSRHSLERKEDGEDWAPASSEIASLVYASLDTSCAIDLAKGLPLSDGSIVRFAP